MDNQKSIIDSSNGRRLTLISLVALGVLGFAAPSTTLAEVSTAGYKWNVRGLEQEAPVTGGVFSAGATRAKLSVDEPLAENMRLTVEARFSRNGGLHILTGRGNECISAFPSLGENPTIDCRYVPPAGTTVRKVMYVGGQNNPNFGWTETLLDWIDHFRGLNAVRMPDQRWMRFTLELRGGHCRFLLNGTLLHEWEATEDLYGRLPVVEMDSGIDVRVPEIQRLSAANARFEPVDISGRYNASGLEGESIDPSSLPARGKEVFVGGIPFELGLSAVGDYDNLDVGQSWFREGNQTSYEAPHRGSFGGRWPGSLTDDPTRLQFRVPRRPFTAIHLLAASEDKPNTIPRLTAQFFRPGAGFPKNFSSGEIPLATATATADISLPIRSASGKALRLWLVTIPVEPGMLQEFDDLDILEVELTKDVQIYRAYPDPSHYSAHAAGFPSAVHVFAMTLGVAPVEIRFDPEALGNVWVESVPAYRVTAKNNTSETTAVQFQVSTVSYDGSETNTVEQAVSLAAGDERTVRFDLPLQSFGHHEVTLLATANGETQTHARTLSRLRRREYKARPYDTKGFMFGSWNWSGGHRTPGEVDELTLTGIMGMESTGPNPGTYTKCPETMAVAAKYGMRSFWGGPRYSEASKYLEDPVQSIADLERKWQDYGQPLETPTHAPTYVKIFAEPGGTGTHGVLPEFYGEPPFKMDEAQQAVFTRYHEIGLASAEVAKRMNPNLKILFPWGDPSFAIPFLQKNDKLTELMDGVGVDVGYFDRLPEMQMHQCALHRTYQFTTYWKQFKDVPPVWPSVEGPCIGQVAPGALTPKQHADHFVRSAMILAAYGVNRQFAMGSLADCADWWGEQHYGGGFMSRLSGLNPHPAYSAVATMIRHLRYMEFIDWVPTGSLSVYCLHFRDSRDAKDMYVSWTLRGAREIALGLPKGTRIRQFDDMDNVKTLAADEAGVSLTINTSPQYLYDVGENPVITLGAPDHSDSVPGPYVHALGNIADRFITQGDDADTEYIDSFPDAIRRFYATMDLVPTNAPEAQGGKALAVTLPPQKKDRGVMPFYTVLKPEQPVLIPGKGQYLTLWVQAASDWGRVVYVVRDAKGEKWTSVGSMNKWNSDDTPGASAFNFDGWRLLRFELPSHAPYDTFREMGTTWWGSSGGDGVVDLPLSLEKIFVERRPQAMYVNSLEPTDPAPVLLADLAVEYASAEDSLPLAVTRNRTRLPAPPKGSPRVNPIAELTATATLPAGAIENVSEPDHYYDGTRGHFHFKEMPEAVRYDIYLSLSADGANAIKLGNGLKASGVLVSGFVANTDFYAFIIYYNRAGQHSQPSPAFKLNLKDNFGNK